MKRNWMRIAVATALLMGGLSVGCGENTVEGPPEDTPMMTDPPETGTSPEPPPLPPE